MPKLSIEKKARVSALLDEGYSMRDVSIKENVGKSSVARIGQLLKRGLPISDLSRSGRPTVIFRKTRKKNYKACIFGQTSNSNINS
jgi:transposase